MARHATVALTAGDWVELTNANVTEITISNDSDYEIYVTGTADATQPTTDVGSILLRSGEVLLSDISLSTLWPGILAVRVWGKCAVNNTVQVSHA